MSVHVHVTPGDDDVDRFILLLSAFGDDNEGLFESALSTVVSELLEDPAAMAGTLWVAVVAAASLLDRPPDLEGEIEPRHLSGALRDAIRRRGGQT